MRLKNLMICMVTGAALCACSSDDLTPSGAGQNVFDGDKAYVTVRISDVGSSTRATSTDFGYGTPAEQDVGNAYFYFYDTNGLFVSEGEVWNNGSATTENPNIEYGSETVVILKGLTEKNYPRYVVTVLNRPTGFTAPETLSDMEKALAKDDEVGIKDANGRFTMSTTSYFGSLNNPDTRHYFVTELRESDFKTAPIADDLSTTNPVEIYVERLAAKVTLNIALESETSYNDGHGVRHTIYPIDETIAGVGKTQTAGETRESMGTYAQGTATESIYVELLGWKLNATARHSYMVKNITPWTDDYLNFKMDSWNDATDHRSYWGMSYNYGLTDSDYPESSGDNTPSEEAEPEAWLNDYLQYVNLADEAENPLLSPGASAYCAENTNTALNYEGINRVIKHKNSSAITSILVKARLCDKEGNSLNLVRYNGELFSQGGFLKYVLSHLQLKGELNYYYKTGDESYSKINSSYVELTDAGDGIVDVTLKSDQQIYKLDEGQYTLIEEPTTIFADDAVGYKDGEMYYNIPIQHLNNDYQYNDNNVLQPQEANFGVVRNHHYVVTINKLENVGKGIFDPEEVIIPDPDDHETYYVGANINILSWKLVQQSVAL